MAVYHLNVKTLGKSNGASATAAASYILRAGLYQDRKDDLILKADGNMPRWVSDDLDYWQAADEHERANGRLGKMVEFSLLRELEPSVNYSIAADFAKLLTEGEKLPFVYAIHQGTENKPHCHLLVNERTNDGMERSRESWFKRYNRKNPELGGAFKSTSLKPNAWLIQTRLDWQRLCNEQLREAGLDLRIDSRSYEDQGIVTRQPRQYLDPRSWFKREKARAKGWDAFMDYAAEQAHRQKDRERII